MTPEDGPGRTAHERVSAFLSKVTEMSASCARIRFISAALVFTTSGGVAAQAERSPCATANADIILRNSATSKAAQGRLAAEFSPQLAAIDPLATERNRIERLWLDAKRAGRPGDEVEALRVRHEKAASAEREAAKPVRKALERRKQEELGALVARVNEIYKRIGAEQNFKLLLQEGEQEPVFVLDKGIKRSDCKGEVDLTSQIIAVLDRGEFTKP